MWQKCADYEHQQQTAAPSRTYLCTPLPNRSVELLFYFAFVNHSSTGCVCQVFDTISLLTHVQLQWPSVTTIKPEAKTIFTWLPCSYFTFYRNIKINKVTNSPTPTTKHHFRTLGGANRWWALVNVVMNLRGSI
jgi:hypothetical protein